ncbi:MAG: hypothetical protein HYV34_00010 [Candidatus Kerfeldbacteria bacterium]|nr:hypothetical protein [Candidatus Kerfeldbacteria bacterium]
MDLLPQINAKRDIQKSDIELSRNVKYVAVVLTSSRSGSSLIKKILEQHSDVASLSSETEPFLTLSQNGFAFGSDSDALTELVNKDILLDNIFDDLGVPSSQLCDVNTIKTRWRKRFLIHFPNLFSDDQNYQKLLRFLDKSLLRITDESIKEEAEIHKIILNNVFKDEPWRINYYDNYSSASCTPPFNELSKIEEPPFVSPSLYKRTFTVEDANNKVLIFKTPQDCYRIGMYEQLFPNAEIKYIHLTRGYAQTVNGLIDGWLSPIGFFAHDMEKAKITLAIKGYSDFLEFGKKWWKFDLPPNWRNFTGTNLVDVCANQWISAHKTILDSKISCLRVHFEDFISNPSQITKIILEYLGLKNMETPNDLPLVMAIEKPKPYRWQKREGEILALGERKEVKEIMGLLGYTMDPKTWL